MALMETTDSDSQKYQVFVKNQRWIIFYIFVAVVGSLRVDRIRDKAVIQCAYFKNFKV